MGRSFGRLRFVGGRERARLQPCSLSRDGEGLACEDGDAHYLASEYGSRCAGQYGSSIDGGQERFGSQNGVSSQKIYSSMRSSKEGSEDTRILNIQEAGPCR